MSGVFFPDRPVALTGEYILADDWEIIEEKKKLGWSEIKQAIERASGTDPDTKELLLNMNMVRYHLGFWKEKND